jgi:hypothetical protein
LPACIGAARRVAGTPGGNGHTRNHPDNRCRYSSRTQCLNQPSATSENSMRRRHYLPGEGKRFELGRMTMTFKATAENGWNAWTVGEAIEPPE